MSSCTNPECTYDVTGVCLQGSLPQNCPSRLLLEEKEELYDSEGERSENPIRETRNNEIFETDSILESPVLEKPSSIPRLPASMTLDLKRASHIRNTFKAITIGILGLPDSGKTACLASMYLLLSKNRLNGFSYINSETLMAFEDISRGIRRWNEGIPPTQMTTHTELSDDREAGFLHLRLRATGREKSFDLLIPDIPGEWSSAFIDRKDSERLNFLKSCNVIWIMIDGRKLLDINQANFAIHQTKCLIQRLAELMSGQKPKLLLVPSWHDLGIIKRNFLDRIIEEGSKCNFEIETIEIASFSEDEYMQPGFGISELIQASTTYQSDIKGFWPLQNQPHSAREIIKFRRS